MSLHKSLKVRRFDKKVKNIRKKEQRFKDYLARRGEKIAYKNIFNLPKEKIIKMKVKKVKDKKNEETNV